MVDRARRRTIGGLSAGALLMAAPGRGRAAGCLLTPEQTSGPFYPKAFDEVDADLTHVAGAAEPAKGEVIAVVGRVLDADCRAVPRAVIEVWQANAAGRYDHPGDSASPRPLDAGFQGSARFKAGPDDGAWRFLTVKPGAYPVGDDWWRPPHIHFRVVAPDGRTLVTQLYFAGEEMNARDAIYAAIPEAERPRVTVAFAPLRAGGVPTGRFDIVLPGR